MIKLFNRPYIRFRIISDNEKFAFRNKKWIHADLSTERIRDTNVDA